MALQEQTFKILIIVECGGKIYKRNWEYLQGDGNGCNHFENMPGTAKYMGEEILKEIKET